jgi:ribosomal protein S12 methylthiotransferase
MRSNSYYLLSLGCAKNTVDSASISSLMNEDGYLQVFKPNQAEYLIVNTCGFIESARKESLEALITLSKKIKDGQKLIAAGCMPDRYRDLMLQTVPRIDGFLSTQRWMDILQVVHELKSPSPASRELIPGNRINKGFEFEKNQSKIMRAAIQGGSAYLKIADGCRRGCAFCSIPLIKGLNISRPVEEILQDAIKLQQTGIKELILIAQDTTDYGSDLGMKDGLSTLLSQLTQVVPDIPWLRVLYAFPGYVTDRLIEIMAAEPQILHYLDIPLQHSHPEILKSMKRPFDANWVHQTIGKMRKAMPDLSLRTTFIVGYPGETDSHFNHLLEFMKEMQFDHVGAFKYSFESGTPAEPLGDPIPEEIKENRLKRLMETQEKISLSKNQYWIGKRMDILVEGFDSGITIGRSYRDAPEIDGLVIAEGQASVGSIIPVRVSGAMVHDLMAVVEK